MSCKTCLLSGLCAAKVDSCGAPWFTSFKVLDAMTLKEMNKARWVHHDAGREYEADALGREYLRKVRQECSVPTTPTPGEDLQAVWRPLGQQAALF